MKPSMVYHKHINVFVVLLKHATVYLYPWLIHNCHSDYPIFELVVQTAVCLKYNRLPWILLGSMHAISTMIIGEPFVGDMPL